MWIDHVKLSEHGREIDEFNFSCDSCKRQYQFKDDQIIEKRLRRDPTRQMKESKLISIETTFYKGSEEDDIVEDTV